MDAEFSLDQPMREPGPDLRKALRLARIAYGTTYLDQLGEMLALGLARNGLELASSGRQARRVQGGLVSRGRTKRLRRDRHASLVMTACSRRKSRRETLAWQRSFSQPCRSRRTTIS